MGTDFPGNPSPSTSPLKATKIGVLQSHGAAANVRETHGPGYKAAQFSVSKFGKPTGYPSKGSLSTAPTGGDEYCQVSSKK